MDDLPVLDAHAHVWDRTCRYVAGSRYRPAYTAPVDGYLRLLDANGVGRAVLVQPSFLGTDNSYLLAALAAHPDRLRGIVVTDPGTGDGELDDMAGVGVIGIRYNLLSLPPATPGMGAWPDLTQRAAARGWWVEIQANGPDWPLVLPHVAGARLMIDHFGRPTDVDCPGFAGLVMRDPATTCVKFSAPYRQSAPDLPAVARRMIAHLGADRCLWGSDWPWTQHEAGQAFARCRLQLTEWAAPGERAEMRRAAPGLTGFTA